MISQKLLADMNRSAAQDLAKAAQNLGDKITWKPLDKGRSALSQVQECAGFNLIGVEVFTTGRVTGFDMAQMDAEYDTPEKALALLIQASDDLARAIEAFPDERMTDTFTLPFGGGMVKTYSEIALMVYWNTVYHEGQVNYIETLSDEYQPEQFG